MLINKSILPYEIHLINSTLDITLCTMHLAKCITYLV